MSIGFEMHYNDYAGVCMGVLENHFLSSEKANSILGIRIDMMFCKAKNNKIIINTQHLGYT